MSRCRRIDWRVYEEYLYESLAKVRHVSGV